MLLKLNRPANIAPNSRVKKICLPFADIKVNSVPFDPRPELDRLHQQTKTSQLFYFDYLGRPPDKGGGRPVEEDGPTKEDVVDEESELNAEDASTDFPDALPDREDNYLRRLRLLGESGAPEYRRPRTARVVVNQLVRKRLQQSPSSELVGNATRARSESASRRSFRRGRRLYQTADFDDDDDDDDEDNGWGTRHGGKRRRNDKFAHGGFYRNEHYRNEFGEDVGGGASDAEPISAIPDTSQYVDCLATGWGKSTIDDELTDILLQTKAPIQNSKKYCHFFFSFLYQAREFWLFNCFLLRYFCCSRNRMSSILNEQGAVYAIALGNAVNWGTVKFLLLVSIFLRVINCFLFIY